MSGPRWRNCWRRYGCRCWCCMDCERREARCPLALTVAALWLTDAPAGVMGMYFLALLVVAAAIEEKRWALVRRAAAATALGLGLAGFWLVPAYYEERWVEIWRAIGLADAGGGQLPVRLREPGSCAGGGAARRGLSQPCARHGFVGRADAAGGHGCGGGPDLAEEARRVVVAAGNGGCGHRSAPVSLERRGVADGAGTAGICSFPGDGCWCWGWCWQVWWASRPGPCMATQKARRVQALAAVALACVMATLAGAVFWQPCDEDDNVQAQLATFRDGGFAGTDEYTPRGAANERYRCRDCRRCECCGRRMRRRVR